MPAKHRFEDDDTAFDSKVGSESSELMDRLEKQFKRLQMKAAEIGVQSVVILHANDPLTGYSFRRNRRVGDHYSNLGAVTAYQHDLLSGLTDSE